MKNSLSIIINIFIFLILDLTVLYSQDSTNNLLINQKEEIISNNNKKFEQWANTRTGNYGLSQTPEIKPLQLNTAKNVRVKQVSLNRLAQLADESNANVEDTSKFTYSTSNIVSKNNENDYFFWFLPIILIIIILIYLFLINSDSYFLKSGIKKDDINSKITIDKNENTSNIIDELNKLQILKAQGVITNEEFIHIKNSLFKNMR